MVESLKELNKIVQKPCYREQGNWMVRRILRDAALPATWLLLHTNVTANQVTLVSLIIGAGGVFFLGLPSLTSFWFGVIGLQLWYYLDHVDGQIARYRKTVSLSGRYFDFVTHHLIHGILFFGLGFYLHHRAQNDFFLVLGFTTSLSMILFNMISDTKYKTFFEKLVSFERIEIRPKPEIKKDSAQSPKASKARRIYSFLHKCVEMHVVMNILTLAVILESFFPKAFDWRGNLFMVYAILVPFLAISKITYLISTKKLDAEFEAQFQCEEGALR